MSSELDFESRLNRRTIITGAAGGVMFSGLGARLVQLQLFVARICSKGSSPRSLHLLRQAVHALRAGIKLGHVH